jgi:hypothetical protein
MAPEAQEIKAKNRVMGLYQTLKLLYIEGHNQ